jgi:Spy/CpxP family protein refolding chaperone
VAASMKTAIAIASGMLALGAGIGVANLAPADTTPTPSPTSTPSGTPAPETGRGWPGPGRGSQDGGLAGELADKLGVAEAKVVDALRTIKEENRPSGRPDPMTKPDLAEREAAPARALSSKLGIDEAKIKSALDEIQAAHQSEREAALKSRLDAAVQSGTLTPAEADAVQKAVDQGVINFGHR